MKYFIPTTILNLSNILSTDSISPAVFYQVRNFGSPHWKDVNDMINENVIILYSSPFYFNLESHGQENRPMFISIDTNEEFNMVGEGVYSCDHTLYFDWNTCFLFLSEDDLNVANSLALIGDATKMYRLYRDKRMIVAPEINNIKKKTAPHIESNLNIDAINKDYRLNKMKGLLYGYYVGAILSCRKQDVGAIKALRRVYDKVASMVSSYSIQGKSSEEIMRYSDEVKKCLNEEILVQNRINRSHGQLVDPSEKEVVVNSDTLMSIGNIFLTDNREKKLFSTWINNILCDRKWGRAVNSVKSQLADELTDEAKLLYQEEWETSSTRIFLNDLRHALVGETFHQQWSNDMYSSLAAFLMRGDDWKGMMDFMEIHEMNDYRLAFAFYGVWTGFASMPTEFTDYFFIQEKLYIKKVYDEFYQQLFGKVTPTFIKKETLRDKVMKLWNDMPTEFKGKTKKDEKKNLDCIEIALHESEAFQSIDRFLKQLSEQKGWKKGDKIKYFRTGLSNNLFY